IGVVETLGNADLEQERMRFAQVPVRTAAAAATDGDRRRDSVELSAEERARECAVDNKKVELRRQVSAARGPVVCHVLLLQRYRRQALRVVVSHCDRRRSRVSRLETGEGKDRSDTGVAE